MNAKEQMSRFAAVTEDMLRKELIKVENEKLLYDAMAYSLFAGGKRIRPVLCLSAADMLCGDYRAALPAACALEMIHTYSLIHDDLPAMDNDDFRRGKPTNHKVFGEANAILAGDGLLSYAFLTAARMDNCDALCAIAQGAFDMVAGQSLDLNPAGDEAALLRIHRLKTGALIRAATLSGAYAVHGEKNDIAALAAFSDAYGLLFQITDDILDVVGEEKLLGKSIGKDAAESKMTFVTCYGLDEAAARARQTAEDAHGALLPFGARAEFFHELIDLTLTRDH